MKDKFYSFEQDREKVKKLVNSDNFIHLIAFLIIFDSMLLGFMTSGFIRLNLEVEFFLLDRLIVALFISEMLMKLYAFRGSFFKNGWNILDLSVVIISIIPATSYFVILRSLRLLRLLKYLDKNKKLSRFFETFRTMIPILGIALITFMCSLYIFSIISIGLFGDIFVEFSSLGDSMTTLIQVLMSNELSTNIVESVHYVYPYSWVLFLVFNMLSYLIGIAFVITSLKSVIDNK